MRTFIFAVACIYKDQKTVCSVRGGDLCGVSDSMFVPKPLYLFSSLTRCTPS